MTEKASIATLADELEKATEAHREAKRSADDARRVESNAVNRLNRAQKAMDEAVEALRKAAPWNTDWHSRRNRGEAIPNV